MLTNHGDREVKGTVKGEIGDITFSQPYALKPGASATVTFTPEQFPPAGRSRAQALVAGRHGRA